VPIALQEARIHFTSTEVTSTALQIAEERTVHLGRDDRSEYLPSHHVQIFPDSSSRQLIVRHSASEVWCWYRMKPRKGTRRGNIVDREDKTNKPPLDKDLPNSVIPVPPLPPPRKKSNMTNIGANMLAKRIHNRVKGV
jgi:hypothetical protein